MMRHAGQRALAVLAVLAPAPVWASTASATLAVGARVEPSCNLDVQPLRFAPLRSGEPRVDSDSSLAVSCTPETSFVVTMDEGQNPVESGRRMADAAGGGFLAYDIYSDAARTRRWGASLAEAVTGQIAGGGAAVLPIYARADARGAGPGAYSDVVTITVSF
jgi:spore coat protein U-like protein